MITMAEKTFHIGSRTIGPGHPCYIIAEMSANHGHNYEQAMEILRAAKEAGADAIKLQTYTPDTLTIDCQEPYFRIGKGTIWEGKNLYQLYGEAYTPWEWQPKLKNAAEELGMDCFSSPFDATAVDFLESMQVDCYKIASFELVDLPLIRKTASTGKPIIMSTGMATLSEIEEAVNAAREAGCLELALLKCNSGYPAPPEEMNLRTIPHMADAFGVVTGLSDHTLTTTVPVAAVTLGACIIEKHITLDRSVPGPDSAFSLEPKEFREMVEAVRITEQALGEVRYQPAQRELASRLFRKSIFVTQDVNAGEPFTVDNVKCIRPGNGLHPRHWQQVLQSLASYSLSRGTPLELSHLK